MWTSMRRVLSNLTQLRDGTPYAACKQRVKPTLVNYLSGNTRCAGRGFQSPTEILRVAKPLKKLLIGASPPLAARVSPGFAALQRSAALRACQPRKRG